MAKHTVAAPVRVRSTEDASGEVRTRALKLGSDCVRTQPVGPDLVETIASFAKKKDAIEFKTWAQKQRRNGMEIVDE